MKYIMYLTGQHPLVPEPALVADVSHVALAFMSTSIFNNPGQQEWPLFTTVDKVREKFAQDTKIQIAIGGWGDTTAFSRAAQSEANRKLFAMNVAVMLEMTGADGVDVDWEYPGGNGEDYKTHPNEEKEWEIDAYAQLLAEIRTAIGPEKIISAAVPGLQRDMIAFNPSTIPKIMESVDFLNVMTYDLMNRRDNVTKHHTGLAESVQALDAYIERGFPAEKINLGLAFYVKWFKTAEDGHCDKSPLGCKTELMEDPDTGGDLGKAGAFSWHDEVPTELVKSFSKALKHGEYDQVGGGHYYWDEEERLFWSWDTAEAIERKLKTAFDMRRIGGVFAWGLGEDATEFRHLKAANKEVRRLMEERTGEERERPERSEL
ncbi:similar to 42 kDa endochitinase [Plenodomus lingam JN3]|uniref:chitinase n=1 Tax=Leptosphaeria maculans (strain JN3 / isolate v23.1.3 / race Av1-4-5-6-7-8) TaxID=985895 RepID=E5ABP4_LEPMJ|nr:similar to 42 kDa endochitinase [Plenodomus lingam JN3]CBY01085.1 similar to 42 kDa endochitinase [Plenodomus lingam JN3]